MIRFLPLVVLGVALTACGADGSKNANAPGEGGAGGSGGSIEEPNRPNPIASPFVPGDCNLEEPAFCETFETPHPGGRGGDLDETKWSASRHGHVVTEMFTRTFSSTDPMRPNVDISNTALFCGETFSNIAPPNDMKFCDGVDGGGYASKQFNEVLDDWGGFAINSMMIRQPFDFKDRTGTIVFDVDAKMPDLYEGHGWWTEVWITPDPAPIPYHGAPTIASSPRHGLGFQFIKSNQECFETGLNNVGRIVVARDYELIRDSHPDDGNPICFKAQDQVLNRVKLLVSTSHAEIWVSDYDQPGEMKKVLDMPLDLHFSYGYVHIQHAHYNANKSFGASPAQTYRWDNVAFDGPAYPTPRGYDVPDELRDVIQSDELVGKSIGYYIDTPRTVTVPGVNLTDGTRATFNFNIHAKGDKSFRYRFNGNEWHTFTVPSLFGSEAAIRAFSVEVPMSELVNGDNVLDLENVDLDISPVIGNMDVTIEVP